MGLETDKLANTIGTNTKDTNTLAEDTFPDDQGASLLIAPIDNMKVTLNLTGYKRVINNVLTVGHSTYGVVHSYRVYVPIVLGHSSWGVLGKGYLSSTTTYSRTSIFTYTS